MGKEMSLIAKALQWGRLDVASKSGPGSHFSILSFAKTPTNETVALNISDYEPWIHVVLPEGIPIALTEKVARDIFKELQKKLAKSEHSPIRYELAMRYPFFYYTTKKRICMKIHFETEDAARHCTNLLRWPVLGHILIPVDTGKISQETKLHAELNIRPCDWISFNGIPLPFQNPEHVTTLPVEYDVPWRTIKPLEQSMQSKQNPTKPSILVFDHEMYSARKYAFPDELNSSDCIFMTGVLFVKYSEEKKEYEVEEYCLVYHRTITKEQIEPIPYTTLTRVGDQKYIIGEDSSRHVELRWYKTEMDQIDAVELFIKEKDPDCVLGHNSNGFDFKYHKVRKGRLMRNYNNMSRLKDWNQNFQHIEWSSSAYKDIEMDVPDGLGRVYLDTMFMKQRDYQKEDSYGLDALCQEHMGIGKHDHSAQKIFESFESSDPKKLRETIVYCMRDVWCTWGLFNHLNYMVSYVGMANVIGVGIFDLYAQGQGIRTITQIFKECYNKNYFIDAPVRIPRRIAGGHVFETPRGLYEWLWLYDFEGLYPSIIMEYNLGPDTFDKDKLAPDNMCNEFKWTDSEGEWHTRFVKKELREGLIPRILAGLKASRKASKDEMAACKKAGDVAGAMNADAEQNGKKVSMNSIYGAMAQPNGPLSLTECGATVTWLGRTLVQKAANWLQKEGYELIYGDSVTGNTPLMLRYRDTGKQFFMTIEEFFNTRKNLTQVEDNTAEPKEHRLVNNVDTWSDKGWTPVENVMRHKTSKRIYEISTLMSSVQVTEDHSMLLQDGTPSTPKNLKINDHILEVFNLDGKIGKGEGLITSIKILEQSERYVYDLTTKNHHFQAGIGGIIVHNTDSVMVRRIKPLSEEEKLNFEKVGKDLLARLNKENFGGHIGMAMDGCFRSFFTLEKKMYSFCSWDPKDPLGINPDKWKSKGMVTARRDSCKMMRRLYKRLSIMITTLKPVEEIVVVLFNEIERLLSGELDIEEMITIKGVSSDYKVPSNPLAIYSRHLADIGMNIKPGDRVPYVIKMNPKGKKQGDFYEDPELFLREKMEYNRMMYLESQFAGKLDKLMHVAFPEVIPPEFLTKLRDGLSYNRGSSVQDVLLGFMALWVESREEK